MIPSFTLSGVVPPFLPGATPADPNAVSPYKVTVAELVSRFGTSQQRNEILSGYLQYRKELRSIGVDTGFQWIDGSFVEDVERLQSRPPNDIDIVTFADRPSHAANDADWHALNKGRRDLFSPREAKRAYRCDAYYVDLSLSGNLIVSRTAYWFGLFSHQRTTSTWKALMQVDIADAGDEVSLLIALGSGGRTP